MVTHGCDVGDSCVSSLVCCVAAMDVRLSHESIENWWL